MIETRDCGAHAYTEHSQLLGFVLVTLDLLLQATLQ
jgi:hypothetical protein